MFSGFTTDRGHLRKFDNLHSRLLTRSLQGDLRHRLEMIAKIVSSVGDGPRFGVLFRRRLFLSFLFRFLIQGLFSVRALPIFVRLSGTMFEILNLVGWSGNLCYILAQVVF
jgi:hypothetical protein